MRHADNRMAVFARIERQFLTAQLAALPARVEGVLQDVPALPGFIDPCAKLHFAPSLEQRPRGLILASGSTRLSLGGSLAE